MKKSIWQSMALLMVFAMLLSACGNAATATTAPEATKPRGYFRTYHSSRLRTPGPDRFCIPQFQQDPRYNGAGIGGTGH